MCCLYEETCSGCFAAAATATLCLSGATAAASVPTDCTLTGTATTATTTSSAATPATPPPTQSTPSVAATWWKYRSQYGCSDVPNYRYVRPPSAYFDAFHLRSLTHSCLYLYNVSHGRRFPNGALLMKTFVDDATTGTQFFLDSNFHENSNRWKNKRVTKLERAWVEPLETGNDPRRVNVGLLCFRTVQSIIPIHGTVP